MAVDKDPSLAQAIVAATQITRALVGDDEARILAGVLIDGFAADPDGNAATDAMRASALGGNLLTGDPKARFSFLGKAAVLGIEGAKLEGNGNG